MTTRSKGSETSRTCERLSTVAKIFACCSLSPPRALQWFSRSSRAATMCWYSESMCLSEQQGAPLMEDDQTRTRNVTQTRTQSTVPSTMSQSHCHVAICPKEICSSSSHTLFHSSGKWLQTNSMNTQKQTNDTCAWTPNKVIWNKRGIQAI